MTNLALLLNTVWRNNYSLLEAKRRFAHQLTPDFRLFDLVNVDEMRLSNFIAFLLNPNGTHAQGTLYLEMFLDSIDRPEWLINSDLKKCQVVTEKQANGQRRIDIYLEFPNGVIGIENKPWASDQKNQLSDYADFLSKLQTIDRKDNWRLVYLCNYSPSDESISKNKRERLEQSQHLSYLSFYQLADYFENARDKTQPINLRVMLDELMKFIRFKVNSELDMTIINETRKIILQTKENLESAFDIYNTLNSVKFSLVKQFELQLFEKIKNTNPDWSLDMGITEAFNKFEGFSVRFFDTANIAIRFDFDRTSLNRFGWGVKRDNENLYDQQKWIEIKNIMDNNFSKKSTSLWWPWYSEDLTIFSHDDGIKNWESNALAWNMIQDGTLAERIILISKQVYTAFEGKLDLFECHAVSN